MGQLDRVDCLIRKQSFFHMTCEPDSCAQHDGGNKHLMDANAFVCRVSLLMLIIHLTHEREREREREREKLLKLRKRVAGRELAIARVARWLSEVR